METEMISHYINCENYKERTDKGAEFLKVTHVDMKITYGTIWYYGATWCLTELNEALDSTAVGFRASVVYHAAKDSTASFYPLFALLCFAFLSFFLSFHCPFLWSTNWTKPLGRTDFASPTPRKLAATFPIHFPLFSCSLSDQPIAASNFFEVLLYLSIRNPSVLTPCRRIRENPCTVKAIRLLKRREKSGEKLADWMNEGSIPSRNSKSVRSLGRCHTRRPQTSTKLTGRHAMKEHVRCLYT